MPIINTLKVKNSKKKRSGAARGRLGGAPSKGNLECSLLLGTQEQFKGGRREGGGVSCVSKDVTERGGKESYGAGRSEIGKRRETAQASDRRGWGGTKKAILCIWIARGAKTG